MNESCTYDRVVSQSHIMSRVRMIESCHANKRVSCATWLTYKYDMAHSFVWQDWTLLFAWHDSILRTRLITWLCDTTRSYVHDSFIGEKGLIHTCDMTRSYVHDSSQDRVMSHESCVVSTYVTWVLCTYGRQGHVTWVVVLSTIRTQHSSLIRQRLCRCQHSCLCVMCRCQHSCRTGDSLCHIRQSHERWQRLMGTWVVVNTHVTWVKIQRTALMSHESCTYGRVMSRK